MLKNYCKTKIKIMYLTNLSKLNNGLDTFDGIFDSFFNFPNVRPTLSGINSFGTDYIVNDDSLEVSLPGFSKKDINIEIDGNVLAISSDVKENGFRQSFEKKFRLPNTVDMDSISATMKDGILTISFTKTDSTRKVSIK